MNKNYKISSNIEWYVALYQGAFCSEDFEAEVSLNIGSKDTRVIPFGMMHGLTFREIDEVILQGDGSKYTGMMVFAKEKDKPLTADFIEMPCFYSSDLFSHPRFMNREIDDLTGYLFLEKFGILDEDIFPYFSSFVDQYIQSSDDKKIITEDEGCLIH